MQPGTAQWGVPVRSSFGGKPMALRTAIARCALALGIAGAGLLVAPMSAGAQPVAPTPVADERPCRDIDAGACPVQPSEDELSWCYRGVCSNYDKLGNFVCTSGGATPLAFLTDPFCNLAMAGVRALPPFPLGEWI